MSEESCQCQLSVVSEELRAESLLESEAHQSMLESPAKLLCSLQ